MTKEIAEAVVTRFYIELENKYLKEKKTKYLVFTYKKGRLYLKTSCYVYGKYDFKTKKYSLKSSNL